MDDTINGGVVLSIIGHPATLRGCRHSSSVPTTQPGLGLGPMVLHGGEVPLRTRDLTSGWFGRRRDPHRSPMAALAKAASGLSDAATKHRHRCAVSDDATSLATVGDVILDSARHPGDGAGTPFAGIASNASPMHEWVRTRLDFSVKPNGACRSSDLTKHAIGRFTHTLKHQGGYVLRRWQRGWVAHQQFVLLVALVPLWPTTLTTLVTVAGKLKTLNCYGVPQSKDPNSASR